MERVLARRPFAARPAGRSNEAFRRSGAIDRLQQQADRSPRVAEQEGWSQRLGARGAPAAGPALVQREPGLDDEKTLGSYALPLAGADLIRKDPSQRLGILSEAVNRALAAAGVPTVTLEPNTHGFGTLDKATWVIRIPEAILNSTEPELVSQTVGTLYHEARHAEQYFRVAQWLDHRHDSEAFDRLGLAGRVSALARESSDVFSEPDPSLVKNVSAWAESFVDPRAVLGPMEDAELALARQVDVFKAAVREVVGVALAASVALDTGGASAVNVDRVLAVAAEFERQKDELWRLQGKLDGWTRKYRGMAHERDAHIVGWRAEDTFLGGAVRREHEAGYQGRFPEGGVEMKALARVFGAVAALAAAAVDVVTLRTPAAIEAAPKEPEDDLLEFEETLEEKARARALLETGQSSGKAVDEAFARWMDFLQKQAAAPPPEALSLKTVQKRIAEVNEALGLWSRLEDIHLQLISAQVLRRSVF